MAAVGTALHMAPKPKKLSPKQIEENRVAEEARLAAEATAEDVALLESFRANVEEWLLDEAKGEDALAEVLAAAAAAKKERRQAAERKKIEEVMWAEAVQADEELEARAEELRLAELARIEAKRREKDAQDYARLEPLLRDQKSLPLCRTLAKRWGELQPMLSSLGGAPPADVPDYEEQLLTPGERHARHAPSSNRRRSQPARAQVVFHALRL